MFHHPPKLYPSFESKTDVKSMKLANADTDIRSDIPTPFLMDIVPPDWEYHARRRTQTPCQKVYVLSP